MSKEVFAGWRSPGSCENENSLDGQHKWVVTYGAGFKGGRGSDGWWHKQVQQNKCKWCGVLRYSSEPPVWVGPDES